MTMALGGNFFIYVLNLIGSAQVEKHAEVVDNTFAMKLRVNLQTTTENIDAKTQIFDGGQSSSLVAIVPKEATVPDVVQSSPSGK
jgi:hypothetical protein